MKRIVLASNNPGKVRELNALLAACDLEAVPQGSLCVPEPEEVGLTFVENAILKARNAAKYTALPAIADDSGLEVDALKGAPGIRSARYAGPGADDQRNLECLLEALAGVAEGKRDARYRCVLVYLRHAEDPAPLICQGTWEGQILTTARGSGGFGYDPVFYVPEKGCSAAELSADVKNRLSHRGRALRALLQALQQEEPGKNAR
jgi:XTP/dITP diphosphohydrolase